VLIVCLVINEISIFAHSGREISKGTTRTNANPQRGHPLPDPECWGACAESGQLSPSGLSGGRQWILVSPEGTFVSQLVAHSLSTVVSTIPPDGMRLEAKGGSPLDLPKRWHQEIFLRDPRRVAQEQLSTLLRLPVISGNGGY